MNTALALLATYETAIIPLEKCCDLFGLSLTEANKRAAVNKLPLPTFRLVDSQKAPRLVKVEDLAAYIDTCRAASAAEHEKSNSH